MTLLTVSDEQARLIAEVSSPIVIVDSRGLELGHISPMTSATVKPSEIEDDWAEAKRQREIARREGGRFYTTTEVLEHLKSLEKE